MAGAILGKIRDGVYRAFQLDRATHGLLTVDVISNVPLLWISIP